MTSGQPLQQLRAAPVDELTGRCICARCPSYDPEVETALLFCVHGRSQTLTTDVGCICRDCPVAAEYGLTWKDYCFKGSAEERLRQAS
jgi:hypothetical protein